MDTNNKENINNRINKSAKRKLISLTSVFICVVIILSSCGRINKIVSESDAQTQTETQTEKSGETSSAISAAKEKVYNKPSTAAVKTEKIKQLSEDIKSKADGISKKYGAVGIQAAVLHNWQVSYTYQYGYAVREQNIPVTEDTKFRVASLSKIITDTVFMALVDDGIVREDMDISEVFGTSIRNPAFPNTKITPAMLMTHTSSFIDGSTFLSGRNGNKSISIEDILKSGTSYSGYEPGTHYSYSNLGIALVGSICERASGQSFETLASKYIFTPLKIDAGYTASHLKNQSLLAALYGSGGYSTGTQLKSAFSNTPGATYDLVQGNLTISAKDYAKILSSIMKSASSGKSGIISGSSAQKMMNPQFKGQGYSIGYGQFLRSGVVDGEQLCTHTGINYGMHSSFAVNPKTGNGVVVLTSGAPGTEDGSTEIYLVCLEMIRLLWPS